jgi:hypothetical protein
MDPGYWILDTAFLSNSSINFYNEEQYYKVFKNLCRSKKFFFRYRLQFADGNTEGSPFFQSKLIMGTSDIAKESCSEKVCNLINISDCESEKVCKTKEHRKMMSHQEHFNLEICDMRTLGHMNVVICKLCDM